MVEISSIPAKLEWKNQPISWKVISHNSIAIEAGENTDWFIDPEGNYSKDTAPSLMFTPSDDQYILSAKVKVEFQSKYDAGSIQLQIDKDNWAKLCFEYTPQNNPSIVSVVTRGVSDDCNSVIIDSNEVYLRIAVKLKTIAFHYSRDGKYWNLVRYFALNDNNQAKAGLSAQSPTGKRCEVIFSEILYRSGVIEDIRSGE